MNLPLTRTHFRERMIKPAAGRQVETIQVFPRSAWEAEVAVRFGLENYKTRRIQTFTRTFPVWQEEAGNWRFNLGDFLTLTSSRYW
jgi:hypothetical protein